MKREELYTEKLFSYGTLKNEAVQIAVFGRILNGLPDILQEYMLSELKIQEQDVIKKSGLKTHPIIQYTGKKQDKIDGYVFNVSIDEIKLADQYETEAYQRILAVLNSEEKSWVYVKRQG